MCWGATSKYPLTPPFIMYDITSYSTSSILISQVVSQEARPSVAIAAVKGVCQKLTILNDEQSEWKNCTSLPFETCSVSSIVYNNTVVSILNDHHDFFIVKYDGLPLSEWENMSTIGLKGVKLVSESSLYIKGSNQLCVTGIKGGKIHEYCHKELGGKWKDTTIQYESHPIGSLNRYDFERCFPLSTAYWAVSKVTIPKRHILFLAAIHVLLR